MLENCHVKLTVPGVDSIAGPKSRRRGDRSLADLRRC